jgi:acyl-CoA dehydrogenase
VDFELTDEQKFIKKEVGKLAKSFPLEYWREKDWKHEYPTEFVKEVAKNGWFGTAIPTEYGGAGLGVLEGSIVLEELTAGGGGFDASNACHAVYFMSHSIAKHGTEGQKKKYLPKIATGELRFQSLAITEPNAGFDTTKISTRAEKEGDHYVINGQKAFISRLSATDLMLLAARTTPLDKAAKKTKGISLFLVDVREGGDSIDARRVHMMTRHSVDTNMLFISDLKVPKENLLGEEDNGFYHLLDTLNPERIYLAAECIGLGRLALQRAVEYAKQRVVFDRPIGQNQGIAFPLAESYSEIEAADLMRYKAATMYDKGLQCGAEANMAKLRASEAASKACDRAVQTLGGYGLANDFDVERYYRDIRLMRIAPVSTEMVLNYLSEHVLGLPRSY